MDGDDRDDENTRIAARTLLARAPGAARGTPWLRNVEPCPPACRPSTSWTLPPTGRDRGHAAHHDADGVGPAVHRHPGRAQPGRGSRLRGGPLVGLGRLLAADSFKPAGEGRTDAAWVWPQWWPALEARTEERADTPVSLSTVRQANDQLTTLAHDRGVAAPDGSAVLIVSERALVDQTAAVGATPAPDLPRPCARARPGRGPRPEGDPRPGPRPGRRGSHRPRRQDHGGPLGAALRRPTTAAELASSRLNPHSGSRPSCGMCATSRVTTPSWPARRSTSQPARADPCCDRAYGGDPPMTAWDGPGSRPAGRGACAQRFDARQTASQAGDDPSDLDAWRPERHPDAGRAVAAAA